VQLLVKKPPIQDLKLDHVNVFGTSVFGGVQRVPAPEASGRHLRVQLLRNSVILMSSGRPGSGFSAGGTGSLSRKRLKFGDRWGGPSLRL
jgi:hypothetical protein